MEQTIFLSLILFLSGVLQAVSGFGFAILAGPLILLLQILEPRALVFYFLVVSAILNTTLVVANKDRPNITILWRFTLAALIGVPFGVALLEFLPEKALSTHIALIAIVLALISQLSIKKRLKSNASVQMAGGFIVGMMQTSVGMNGPIMNALLATFPEMTAAKKRSFMAVVFSILSIVSLVLFSIFKVVPIDFWTDNKVLFSLPFLLVGTKVGTIVRSRLNEEWFEKIGLALTICSAVLLVLS